ncbi:hypothetical protein QQ25_07425 [Mycolicibacterium setense]|uniref:Uncharacterized protein n=1 Tax=Mycolicibacterium setense TaxID=431269 RepID=A0ABR4YXF2_9MYCO|nr:hypothetical protein QQ25_07425 [Mycolicibacterium setense]KHO26896.1 hypothetical protein QQ44_04875 [Mycolicibacterium setense]
MHAWWHGARVVAVDDPGVDQIMQMADEHAFGDVGDAAAEFSGAHRPVRQPPQDGALPAPVDDRQGRVDRAVADLFLGNRHGSDLPHAD